MILTRYALLVFLMVVIYQGAFTLHAQVRSSGSYQIQSDSINIGGGLSSSTNFRQESTVGEVASGPSDGTTYNLRAGYQQMQAVFISMTAAANVSMTPAIPGIGGGTANGSSTVSVLTDSPAGYQLTITASNAPAMRSGVNSIADYVSGGDPDFDFTTGSGETWFGFSPTGPDVVQRFLDDGVDTCNTDSNNTDLACWEGLDTTAIVIAESGAGNQPTGASTTINFRVGVGGSANPVSGTYTATTTLTALAL